MLPTILRVSLPFVLFALLFSVVVFAQNGSPGKPDGGGTTLTAEQLLKKDVFLLKVENAQLKARLADRESRITALELVVRQQVEQQFANDSKQLSEQCKELEADFRTTLKPAADAKFDCATLEFKQ